MCVRRTFTLKWTYGIDRREVAIFGNWNKMGGLLWEAGGLDVWILNCRKGRGTENVECGLR